MRLTNSCINYGHGTIVISIKQVNNIKSAPWPCSGLCSPLSLSLSHGHQHHAMATHTEHTEIVLRRELSQSRRDSTSPTAAIDKALPRRFADFLSTPTVRRTPGAMLVVKVLSLSQSHESVRTHLSLSQRAVRHHRCGSLHAKTAPSESRLAAAGLRLLVQQVATQVGAAHRRRARIAEAAAVRLALLAAVAAHTPPGEAARLREAAAVRLALLAAEARRPRAAATQLALLIEQTRLVRVMVGLGRRVDCCGSARSPGRADSPRWHASSRGWPPPPSRRAEGATRAG